MSGTIQVSSPSQLSTLISGSRVVVVFFHNDNASCTAIAPVYDQLAAQLSRPNVVSFSKVNTQEQTQIAQSYNVANPPTFVIYKNGQQLTKVNGANPQQLSDAIRRLATEADSSDGSSSGGLGQASSSGGGTWRGAGLPRGYSDVTDQVDVRGLDLMNADSDFGTVRTLFETSSPLSVGKAKGKGVASGSDSKKDWVESDVDEQLMLYIPFTSTLKVHTVHLTSFPPSSDDDDDDAPMRPKTVHLYINRQHNLGFEEAEDIPAIQTIELKPSDWDEKTGTAKLELRFVKFQNVTSLILFVADGEGSGEKTRIDRIRIIGDAGEKREMGKLEKIGDDS